MKLFYCTFFILFGITAVFAASDAPVEKKQEPIVITGRHITKEPSSSETVIIDEASKELYSLTDILADRVGVQIKRYGGTGSYSTVSIRGSSPTQVAVFIDGIPLSDSVFGEVNLETVPIDCIEKIEIYRGSAPLRFGTDSIGGVINLVTKKTHEEPEAKIAQEYGSLNTFKTSAYYTSGLGKGSFLISGYRHSSNGNFSYRNDNGTNINTSDDYNVTRKNNDYISYGSTLKSDYISGNKQLYLLNDFQLKDQGVPDNYNLAEHTSFKNTKNMTVLGLSMSSLFELPWTISAEGFFTARKTLYKNPRNETNSGTKNTDGLYRLYGIKTSTEIKISSIFQKLTFTCSPQEETFTNKTKQFTGEIYNADQNRALLQWGCEDELSIFSEKFILTYSISGTRRNDQFYDSNTFSATHGSLNKKENNSGYNLGMVIHPFNELIYVKGNISRRYRIPSFGELFGDRGFIDANPSLESETSLNRDFGIGIEPLSIGKIISNFSFEYFYFKSDTDKNIIMVQNTQRTLKAFNISGAKITGHEISMAVTFLSHAEIRWNGTIQKAIDTSNISYYYGNYLPNRPEYESSLNIKLFCSYVAITYEHNYTGANYRDRVNSEPSFISKRIYHNIILQAFPFQSLTCSFEIKNITANQTRDIYGYPLPGRTYTGSISYIF
jgi:iron complex outermembrane recepter protein